MASVSSQAIEVFDDPLYVHVLERIEDGEERWQTFGLIDNVLLLAVAHTILERWEQGIEVFRIISARYADRREMRVYEDENS